MAIGSSGVQQGMIVYSSDGEKLGKVLECRTDGFIIEKGLLFPKDYLAFYEDVAEVIGEEIRLALPKDTFAQRAAEGSLKERIEEKIPGRREVSGMGEEVRVPVAEEEIEVAKRDRVVGEVRVKKEVATEHKQVEVPVMKEQVRVERVPPGERTPEVSEGTFQERTASVPIHEEEVEIRKRPVVKEEVRIKKEPQVEQRMAGTEVRKERVDVEDEDAREISEADLPPGDRRDPDRER